MSTSSDLKIFCIGLNKTGTTSIGDAFKILGYARFGWRPGVSGPLVMRWHEGKFDPFLRVIREHEAFEDLPWPLVYREIESRFENARFILTTRAGEDVWLRSIQKHIKRGSNWVGHYLIYGSYDPVADAEMYLNRYRRHNAEVREYFAARPEKLLEMCFEHGDGWEKLCRFLAVETVPDVPFPHANASKSKKAEIER